MSEERAQKFHTDDVSLPKSCYFYELVLSLGKFASTNQEYYPDLGSDTSSVWISFSHSRRDVGCLQFAKSFRKTRLGSKWNTPLWITPGGRLPGAKEHLKRWPCFSERNAPNGNLCSISSKWLILVTRFLGRCLVNGTDLYKW